MTLQSRSAEYWRNRPIKQVPAYPSPKRLAAMEAKLCGDPPLVFAGGARQLKAALAQVADGRAWKPGISSRRAR